MENMQLKDFIQFQKCIENKYQIEYGSFILLRKQYFCEFYNF